MDIDAALYPRKSIERLGVAPGTSMFLCGRMIGASTRIGAPRFMIPTGCSCATGWREVAVATAGEFTGRARQFLCR